MFQSSGEGPLSIHQEPTFSELRRTTWRYFLLEVQFIFQLLTFNVWCSVFRLFAMQLAQKRPVSPHVFEIDNKGMHYKMPINATTSVLNRATGFSLAVGMPFLDPGWYPPALK